MRLRVPVIGFAAALQYLGTHFFPQLARGIAVARLRCDGPHHVHAEVALAWPPAVCWQDVAGTADGDGHHRESAAGGGHEAAEMEGPEARLRDEGAFREHTQAAAIGGALHDASRVLARAVLVEALHELGAE